MFFLSNTAVASEPKPWQMDLQEPAGIIATKANDLHNFLLVVITLISVFVLGLLVYVCIKFREKPNVKPNFSFWGNAFMDSKKIYDAKKPKIPPHIPTKLYYKPYPLNSNISFKYKKE